MVTVEREAPHACACRGGRTGGETGALPTGLGETLRRSFPPLRLAYILRTLTADELALVADPADALIIARIKRMSNERLQRFDDLVPAAEADQRLYRSLQIRWLRDGEYLLGTRLGRSPTPRELFSDFMNNHNGLRFRAYFAMKFPQRMLPKRATGSAA